MSKTLEILSKLTQSREDIESAIYDAKEAFEELDNEIKEASEKAFDEVFNNGFIPGSEFMYENNCTPMKLKVVSFAFYNEIRIVFEKEDGERTRCAASLTIEKKDCFKRVE